MEDLEKLKEKPVATFSVPDQTLLEKVQKIITTGLVTVMAIMMALVVWVVYRPATLSYEFLPFKVIDKRIYHAGEIVPVMVGRCSSLSGTNIYSVTRGFANVNTGVTMIVGSTKVTVKHGCKEAVSFLHQLPASIEPGLYRVIGTAEVPDLFNTKIVEFESEAFEVK